MAGARISRGAYWFVGVIFTLLAISFVASSIVLWMEFRDLDPLTLAVAHSHLFLFFPLFGVVALAAFYLPSVMFTDFYWQSVWLGKWRFALGLVGVLAGAFYFTEDLASRQPRGIWEVAPKALLGDLHTPPAIVPDCRDRSGAACTRQPILATLQSIRAVGQMRTSVTELVRPCLPDVLVEERKDTLHRFCFAASAMLRGEDCCRVQEVLKRDVARLVAAPGTRSMLSRVERVLTFTKAFFIVVLFVIGGLLVVWQRRLDERYKGELTRVEGGILIGAVAMVLWLLMDYGYQQTSDLLFGRPTAAMPIRLSLVLAPWAVLLVLYFSRAPQTAVPQITPGQLLTVVGSNVAALQYDKVANLAFRLLGAGAEPWMLIGLIVFAAILLGLVLSSWNLRLMLRLLRRDLPAAHEPRGGPNT